MATASSGGETVAAVQQLTLLDVNTRRSVVTDIFGGTLWNEIQCLTCKEFSYKEDPFLGASGGAYRMVGQALCVCVCVCVCVSLWCALGS
jgi:hypothetical protein